MGAWKAARARERFTGASSDGQKAFVSALLSH